MFEKGFLEKGFFEKIYALLLRLYPARFRDEYGEEALQLLRDRSRDEKGWARTLRLWMDLAGDLAFSLPRCYLRPARAEAPARLMTDGLPSFHVVGSEAPRPAALLFGAVLSVVALFAVLILLNHAGSYRILSSRSDASQPEAPATWPAGAGPAGTQTGRTRSPQRSASAAAILLDDRFRIDAQERHRVIEAAAADVDKYYVDSEIAKKTADTLLEHETKGDYDAVTDGQVLADLLSQQMEHVSHDPQLIMTYQAVKEPELPPPTEADLAQMRVALKRSNCRFEKVEILPHNVGYVKLNGFPPPDECGGTARTVMARLNNVDALVFDLRDNRGGMAEMTALLAGYLFRSRTHLNDFYDRGANSTEEVWTQPAPKGNRLADKPVYVLTSHESFSAAEGFSYDLKMLKRATLVGETTSGREHMGMPHRIDGHFVIRIPGMKVTNPISGTNWEGKGVEPDVKVPAADALVTAQRMAGEKIAGK